MDSPSNHKAPDFPLFHAFHTSTKIITDGRLKNLCMLTRPPIPCDLCLGVPISHLLDDLNIRRCNGRVVGIEETFRSCDDILGSHQSSAAVELAVERNVNHPRVLVLLKHEHCECVYVQIVNFLFEYSLGRLQLLQQFLFSSRYHICIFLHVLPDVI